MNIGWLIDDIIYDSNYDNIISILKNHKIEYQTVEVIPFDHLIFGKKPKFSNNKIIGYGSTGIKKVCELF